MEKPFPGACQSKKQETLAASTGEVETSPLPKSICFAGLLASRLTPKEQNCPITARYPAPSRGGQARLPIRANARPNPESLCSRDFGYRHMLGEIYLKKVKFI